METLKIIGGEQLRGNIRINGAKNSALPILAATILTSEDVHLDDVPCLSDIGLMADVLRSFGVKIDVRGHEAYIDASDITNATAPYDLVTKMRASFFVLGPILARAKEARIPLPGGCAIGSRPVDLHLKGLRKLGAEITIDHGYVVAKATELVGARVYLDFPSVGATENIMMAATLAKGTTTIENAAQEPEIVDLANFLNMCGAKISMAGSDTITIEGVEKLGGTNYTIIPDRIEAGTFMVAAAITGGDIVLENIHITPLAAIISKLVETGTNVEIIDSSTLRIRVWRQGYLRATDLRTFPYPGFPTDLQAQFMTLLSMAKGTSIIKETVFENRFMHVDELLRMGACIKIEGKSAIVQGVPKLSGAPVSSTDLRAGAALVLAGLAAEGETLVSELSHIDRGYENFESRLASLGANIKRVAYVNL